MELILSIAGSILSVLLLIVLGVISYTHKDQIDQLREANKEKDLKFEKLEQQFKDDIKECNQKIEKLDTQFRILENDKFTELMQVVNSIKTDVALIKQKIEIK